MNSTAHRHMGLSGWVKVLDKGCGGAPAGDLPWPVVRLAKGRAASVNGVVIGADRLSSDLRSSLSVGAYLGLRMYRLDFAKPVEVATANAVARALTRDPGVVFAEPDAQVSIAANS